MTVPSAFDAWNYRSSAGYVEGNDLVGYKIAAQDGDIGKVDKATYDVGAASLVVDTGPWIFGKKVLLPAGVVERVDHEDEKVEVDLTKDQIKDAPEYDANAETGADARARNDTGSTGTLEEDYRTRLADYYESAYGRGPGGTL